MPIESYCPYVPSSTATLARACMAARDHGGGTYPPILDATSLSSAVTGVTWWDTPRFSRTLLPLVSSSSESHSESVLSLASLDSFPRRAPAPAWALAPAPLAPPAPLPALPLPPSPFGGSDGKGCTFPPRCLCVGVPSPPVDSTFCTETPPAPSAPGSGSGKTLTTPLPLPLGTPPPPGLPADCFAANTFRACFLASSNARLAAALTYSLRFIAWLILWTSSVHRQNPWSATMPRYWQRYSISFFSRFTSRETMSAWNSVRTRIPSPSLPPVVRKTSV
mmetsp:Transcript_10162/g.32903  ORF Transcript_10162/g.32903 Transcript_10162/m.32903 type:complete len:278 (+) Transcript_10162:371-1204(+)